MHGFAIPIALWVVWRAVWSLHVRLKLSERKERRQGRGRGRHDKASGRRVVVPPCSRRHSRALYVPSKPFRRGRQRCRCQPLRSPSVTTSPPARLACCGAFVGPNDARDVAHPLTVDARRPADDLALALLIQPARLVFVAPGRAAAAGFSARAAEERAVGGPGVWAARAGGQGAGGAAGEGREVGWRRRQLDR